MSRPRPASPFPGPGRTGKAKASLASLVAALAFVAGCIGPLAGGAVHGGTPVLYRCEAGGRITARYYTLADESLRFVKLAMPGGGEVSLPQVLSASGARYSDDGRWVWWIKGEGGRLEGRTPDGTWQVLYGDCRVAGEP